MAKKKTASRKKAPRRSVPEAKVHSEPKFPYTNVPGALRTFLQEVPKRPKPPKADRALLKAWDIKNNNAYTVFRVLESVGLLDSSGRPTDRYTAYMHAETGPATLATAIREEYKVLFDAAHEPQKQTTDQLKNQFNIHSGGAERTILYQIQTFKTLCDFADFAANSPAPKGAARTIDGGDAGNPGQGIPNSGSGPVIHIDLHIHLPENKGRRDYEAILEDIGKYILGRGDAPDDSR